MLTRIETAYLAILRIVVLVVATIALLVSLFAALTSLPALARQFGYLPTEQAQGGTLAEYIERRKATVPPAPARPGAKPALVPAIRSSNRDVQEAAKSLQRYSKGAASMTIPKWEQEIEQLGNQVPVDTAGRFYEQTRALAAQLDTAKGKRLDVPALRDLLAWNLVQFLDDARMHEIEKAQATSAAIFKLYVASAAFVLFILVVFTFLFVKVERSLRIVRTTHVGEAVDA